MLGWIALFLLAWLGLVAGFLFLHPRLRDAPTPRTAFDTPVAPPASTDTTVRHKVTYHGPYIISRREDEP